MTSYVPRSIAGALAADLDTFPVVVVTGARQTGKSTLVQELPPFAGRPYATLDDFGVREQAAHAPYDLLRRHPTLTLDEVQREPSLLLAVKALVDQDRPRRRGRFVLTERSRVAGAADRAADRALVFGD